AKGWCGLGWCVVVCRVRGGDAGAEADDTSPAAAGEGAPDRAEASDAGFTEVLEPDRARRAPRTP
ncbi:hypothetical protein AB0G81_22910, partial [Streptomyces asoensis]|uniref:hypothetical protein n=1 Tax=Streptomyces asoensis TaxID=249586 RepID=UPI0033F3B7C4